MITDAAVQQLVRQCIGLLSEADINREHKFKQFFRGVTPIKWKNNRHPGTCCRRHKLVFNTFNAIPEYCFDCYKILAEPRSVLELFKLMVVFESMALPDDNTRKCMVETRPGSQGAYKGFMYFQSLDDALAVFGEIKATIHSQVSPDVPVSIKRGCSEYATAYPEYSRVNETGKQAMSYREDWREKEQYADQHLTRQLKPQLRVSYNPPGSPGFTENDALVMYAWLEYAKAIGDQSYKSIMEISNSALPDTHLPHISAN